MLQNTDTMQSVIDISNFRSFTSYTNDFKKSNWGKGFDFGNYLGRMLEWTFYLRSSTTQSGLLMAILQLEEKNPKVLSSISVKMSVGVKSETAIVMPGNDQPYQDGSSSFIIEYDIADLLEEADKHNGKLEFVLDLDVQPKPAPKWHLVSGGQKFDNKILDDFSTLLESGDGADLKIVVPKQLDGISTTIRKVHEFIVKLRAPVLAAALASSKAHRGRDFAILSDVSIGGLNVLLQYIYTGTVPPNWAIFKRELISAATNYDLKDLKAFLEK